MKKNPNLKRFKGILPPYGIKFFLAILVQIVEHCNKQLVNNIHNLQQKTLAVQ